MSGVNDYSQSNSSLLQSMAENKLAPFNPTCDHAIHQALHLLNLTDDHDHDHDDDDDDDVVLFDLGCGDARLLLKAVEQFSKVKCIGIEMDPIFVSRAQIAIGKLSPEMQQRIQVRQGDLLEVGFRTRTQCSGENQTTQALSQFTLLDDATAIYLFLLPKGIQKIKPMLDAIVKRRKIQRRNVKVVAYMFQIQGWEPLIVDRSTKGEVPLYLYQFKFEDDTSS